MKLGKKNLKPNDGFSLIELMAALLIFSALGLAATSYMRKNTTTLSSSDTTTDIQDSATLVQKLLTDDIRQAAFVRPGCGGIPTSATANCANIKVRGGLTPFPSVTKSNMDTATNTIASPANLSDATNTLSLSNDGIRLVQFNFANVFNCKLNTYVSPNPSTTAGTGIGAERLHALRAGCTGNTGVGAVNLAVNGLYLLMESINGIVYSNVFQITAMSDLGGIATSANQIRIDAVSTSSIFNQPGGLGLSGFSSNARIYPIKLVEWAVEPDAGIYRREISPTAGSVNGYTAWNLIQSNVEGIQFFPVTVTTDTVTEHQRTMQFTADTYNNDVNDIRGVSPRIVVKSSKAMNDATLYDNPLTTATTENDHYPRKELKFFVDMQNTHTN